MLRREALSKGEKLYTPESPCSRGHVAYRRVDNGSCVECLKENNRKFMTENREQVSARSKAYRQAHPEVYEAYKNTEAAKESRKRTLAKRQETGAVSFNMMMGRLKAAKRLVSWDRELTHFVTREAHRLARQREKSTGIKWSVDHIVPCKAKLVSGLHVWNNIQVIPLLQNIRKSFVYKVA